MGGFASIAAVNIKADEASTLAHIVKALIDKGNKASKELESAVSGLSVSEDIDKAATLITEAKSPAIFCAPSLFNASRNISFLLDVKVLAVPFEANSRGVVLMGLTTDGKTYKEMTSGRNDSSPRGVNVLYAVGEIPVAKRPGVNFLIAQTAYLTELAKEADVVLPAATYLESKGTIINYLGKIKNVNKINEPAGNSKQHKDIFIELSKVIGKPIKESAAEMKSAFEVSAKPKFKPFEKKQELDANPSEIIESVNTCVINYSRLLWLKETEKATV